MSNLSTIVGGWFQALEEIQHITTIMEWWLDAGWIRVFPHGDQATPNGGNEGENTRNETTARDNRYSWREDTLGEGVERERERTTVAGSGTRDMQRKYDRTRKREGEYEGTKTTSTESNNIKTEYDR